MITYRAKWIMPICQPIIEDGWISIDQGRIVELGQGLKSVPSNPIDLGDVAILPALINAHTHLELSDLQAPLGQAGIKLHQWIGEVIRHRKQREVDQATTCATIDAGLLASHQFGIGMVCDIATTPTSCPSLSTSTSPELVSCAEVLGLSKERSDLKLQLAEEHFASGSLTRACTPGISPHAPYSTPPEVIERCVQLARQHQALLAMHVAETPEERELIEQGTGPFADTLRSMQLYDARLFPWGKNATRQLIERLSLAPRALLIHGNDLRPDEIDIVAKHAHLSVVYCPRTHAFFDHPRHPFAEMLAAGINVALGTDSLASNPDLSIWREVQWLINHRQDVPWQTVLQMATLNAAKAVGCPDLGKLAPKSRAQLLVLSILSQGTDSIAEALVAQEPTWLTLGT